LGQLTPSFIATENQNTTDMKTKIQNQYVDPLDVSTAIKRKFKTIRNFCHASGIKYHVMTSAINGRMSTPRSQSILNQAKQSIHETDLAPCIWCIDDDQRKFVENAVKTRFATLQNFCRQNPQFSLTFVHNVIAGKRKRVDDRVLALIDTLQN
jgi:hypothetical protein